MAQTALEAFRNLRDQTPSFFVFLKQGISATVLSMFVDLLRKRRFRTLFFITNFCVSLLLLEIHIWWAFPKVTPKVYLLSCVLRLLHVLRTNAQREVKPVKHQASHWGRPDDGTRPNARVICITGTDS